MRLPLPNSRAAMTLPELLIAASITAIIATALATVTGAVLDTMEHTQRVGETAQAGRVILARLGRQVASCQRVVVLPGDPAQWPGMDHVLVLWERDSDTEDQNPGQANLVELVLYAPDQNRPNELLELRPDVDPALLAPLDSPSVMYNWIKLFRSGRYVQSPTTVLLDNLEGIHFEVEEFSEPEGIGGLRQQNVLIGLCVRPAQGEPRAFFASAVRRYAVQQAGGS